MENRETVNRDIFVSCFATGALWGGSTMTFLGGESDVTAEVGKGRSEKSSSHSYPAPEREEREGGDVA